MKKEEGKLIYIFMMIFACMSAVITWDDSLAASTDDQVKSASAEKYDFYGGGYAATGQIFGAGYTTELYNSTNKLPTSDAMYIMGSRDGHVWVGGYAGVMRFDGSEFERLDASEGLTSARAIFEDSKGRIWVGTNDNGVVVVDNGTKTHLTYKDGLPSSSIRNFAEDSSGNIFISTTSGICYADSNYNIHGIPGADLSNERILRLTSDSTGRIYGQTASGLVFAIENKRIEEVYTSEQLGMGLITTILADPWNPGNVYIGTEESVVYCGKFGSRSDDMRKIPLGDIGSVHWLNFDCKRIWVSSTTEIGYLNENKHFCKLSNIPVNSGIEMATSDYQGNIWLASSTQGVMKIVTNNFVDLTGEVGLPREVVNSACIYHNCIYIGTDNGLRVLDYNKKQVTNKLTEYVGNDRVRCIKTDNDGNLWVSTYTGNKGVICYTNEETLKVFTTNNGLPHNEVRSLAIGKAGRVLVGTNGGLAVIQDDDVVRTVGTQEGITNTVCLTVEEELSGSIIVGTDGDGLYEIKNDSIRKYGREDGLTSDVVLRVIRDDARHVTWIITSNSIEYMKNGKIYQIKSIPFNYNYDMCFDNKDNAWILSSYGVYSINVEDMLNDSVNNYSLYTLENGLPYSITTSSYSMKDEDGNLYIPGRNGLIKVDINDYNVKRDKVLIDIHSIYCDEMRIYPDANGEYQIPSSTGRVKIKASVMDYTMLNPTVRVYMEGVTDEGICVPMSQLDSLEYTNLPYGDYKLHIQIIDRVTGNALQDSTFNIKKIAKYSELLIVKILGLGLIVLFVGFVVWRIMKSTVVARQYEEISEAKEAAERANEAKSRFLASISHEILTPINAIMGTNEIMGREDTTGVPQEYRDAIRRYRTNIRNASESLYALISELLNISKIETGQISLVEEEYDLSKFIRSAISMTRIRSEEKGIKLNVSIDELLPSKLYGDIAKIEQILLNLLTNSVKYTEVGEIKVNISMTSRKDDYAHLRFRISDTGKGIAKKDLNAIFVTYDRLGEEDEGTLNETGLGLDITYKLVKILGGDIRCKSKVGEGTEFVIDLDQRIIDETPIGKFEESVDEENTENTYKPSFVAPDVDILVVGDNPSNINIIKGLLRDTKVFVTTSHSGEDALEAIKDSKFDIIVIEQVLAGMDGIETVDKIRKYDENIPIYLIVSGDLVTEEYLESNENNGILKLPIDYRELENIIMKHISDNIMIKY
ncbi:hybrid sensor histidine kinase/response regulator [Eubacterium xylanophilum]|uniref:hybrid sensor histidine kinase/response regulator n=1 Tax=Eubacterium xylanophilum TaxID=39497 RepID=UPI0004AEC2A5|nr:two-component regulator propeller domain-containing protein [Eubacterium xylanophilum]